MTWCATRDGIHTFPYETEVEAFCPEHGVTLLWHGPPITPPDLAGAEPHPAEPAGD
ncbi:hypothetical protein [Streptomyces sp. AcH 505]|uniref:hypothetical protein n=1 Tax=Streptomyces sp. AcH 505 TaxID=352211 RepID=UPI000AA61AC3